MEGSPIARGRGRPRKITGEIIKRNLDANGLNVNMIYDRTLITLVDPCSRPHIVGYGLILVVVLVKSFHISFLL